MEFRYSTENDKEEIMALIETCFGARNAVNTVSDLDGRYLLAVDNNSIVGMTGVYSDDTDKDGYYPEIDWTCTHPSYRGKGVMHELFKRVLENVTETIYCSCWRIRYNDHVNLYNVIKDFGFEPYIIKHKCYYKDINCMHTRGFSCSFYEEGYCHCSEDLWIRRV